MYLHLGQSVVVSLKQVVGIFDMENSSIAKSTKAYLAQAQKRGWVVNVCSELPKSFIVCEEEGKVTVYISQISSITLKKRAGFIDDIANID